MREQYYEGTVLAWKWVKGHTWRFKRAVRCCLHKPTLGALRGAEESMSSLCFHSRSCPSLRQFLSCIDVASHYFKVPINPPFIRPLVLIHVFPLLRSLTLSARCCLIPAIFFSIQFSPSSFRGKCQALSLLRVCELWRGRRAWSEARGGAGPWPLLWEICLNASKALIVASTGLKIIFTFSLLWPHHDQPEIQLIIAGPTVSLFAH